ncbi:MAG TPA: hypothetical protein VH682_05050 [Gemmataceae bacterium]|jgi:hypothetical protein
MNLKEFDAKQFLLEKGEQVGLGIALTLMVLMLIVSLFLPSRGFLSGSPVAKAQPLVDGSKSLDSALRTRELPEQERPPKPEDRLITLDTNALRPLFYGTAAWFEPAAPENPARRPPAILALAEATAAFAYVPIDTYIFDRNFNKIMVLKDPEKRDNAGNAQGGKGNALSNRYKAAAGNSPAMTGKGANRFGGAALTGLQGLQAADDKREYDAKFTNLESLTGSEHLARQLQPAHLVLIEGSFPYKEQLDEFRRKLHLDTIQDVLSELVDEDKDKKEKLYAFRFLGVDVERREVDASDKPVGNWTKLKLADQYKIWLMYSGLPFEPDNPKYDVVKPLDGLAMPLLREFHEEGPENQMGMMGPGMRRQGAPGFPGAAPPRAGSRAEEPRKTADSKYPDLASKLQSIQDTVAKLDGEDASKIVTQSNSKFHAHENFNPFSANASAFEADNAANLGVAGAAGKKGELNVTGEIIPDYCLVRLVDIEDVKPGKSYRYRIKVRMANPNYNRDDVASAAYKTDKELESREWFELKDTVHIPLETIYYAVDEKQVNKEKPPKGSLLYDMWDPLREPKPSERYACFQLHRWLESTLIGGTPTPIGDWAIADRVFVARGEAIGRTVKVDLPVWKYTRDAFILPAENQTKKDIIRGRTGVLVNFGQDNPENETLLLDFEGGKVREGKLDDTCAVEVLMLSPDGKLLARNSVTDGNNRERTERREKVQKHIKDVREGKSGGAGSAGGGGLDLPGKR